MKGQIVMSQKELDRTKLISQIESKGLSVEECAELLKVSKRQLYRIMHQYQKEGDKGVIHKLRGKKSNRGYPKELKQKVISLYRSKYNDYGATLFSEKLLEYHNIKISHETLRLWMRENAITTSMRKKRPHRKRRERRTGFGEMLQFDGSIHEWFEERGAKCCLLHAVDDATSKVFLRFAVSENSNDAMHMMWEYVNKYGAPRNIYTDRGSVYYAEGQLTDFTRSLTELGCNAIFAYSPQAKGRVERGNRTFQDRLIKALREKEIANISEANQYLSDTFIREHNDKFSLNPDAPDVHYDVADHDLKNIFCFKTERHVRNDYTITLDGVYIQLLKSESALPCPRQLVQVHKWLNGSLHIQFNGNELIHKVLQAKPKKIQRVITKPKENHPWKIKNTIMAKKKQYKLAKA